MTNGEKLQKIFPNLEYAILSRTVLTNIDNEAWFSLDWWNAEYKEPTTKNDLGVDAISRGKAIAWAEFYTGIYDVEVANKEIMKMLRDLPPATPQEPVIDKIRADIEQAEFTLDKPSNFQDDRTDTEKFADWSRMFKVIMCEIIDKYKGESEVEE